MHGYLYKELKLTYQQSGQTQASVIFHRLTLSPELLVAEIDQVQNSYLSVRKP